MPDVFRIRLALELPALGNQLVPKRLEILDDAVVDQRDRPDDVRVSITDGWCTVGRPARMRDAGRSMQRMLGQLARQLVELALRPAPLELVRIDRADARGVIAAIFEPLEPVEQPLRDVGRSDNPDNPAHACCNSFERRTV